MPRMISFALTAQQVLARQKTVTRRLGWVNLQPGTLLQGVEKAMGLKKGEKVKKLALIRVTDVRREPLARMLEEPEYGREECVLEGFPLPHPLSCPIEFVRFFGNANKFADPQRIITRIAFEYEAQRGREGEAWPT